MPSSDSCCIIIQATGEIAFASLGKGFGFAKDPLEPRFLQNLDRLPENVHFIYGGKSWVSSHSGKGRLS